MDQVAYPTRIASKMTRDRSYGLLEPIDHKKDVVVNYILSEIVPRDKSDGFEIELNEKIESIWDRLGSLRNCYGKKVGCEQLKLCVNDCTQLLNKIIDTLDVKTIKTFHKLLRITSDAINRAQVGLHFVNKPQFGSKGVKFEENETIFEEDDKSYSTENHLEELEEKTKQEIQKKREKLQREEEIKKEQDTFKKEQLRLLQEKKKQEQIRIQEELEFLKQEKKLQREIEEETKKEEILKSHIKKREVIERRKQLERKIDQMYAVQPQFTGLRNLEKVKIIKKDTDLLSTSCFQLRDLTDCEIILVGTSKSIDLFRLKGCKVYIGPVSGSANISDCENCLISVASYQLRIIDSTHCNFYIHCTTNPIIDNVTHLMFASYNFTYDELFKHMQSSNLIGENKWNNIRDFQCLKKGKSSNWDIIPESERISYYYTDHSSVNLQPSLNDSLENPLEICENTPTQHDYDIQSVVSAPIIIQKRILKNKSQKRTHSSVRSEAESGYEQAQLPRRTSQRNGSQTNYQMIAHAKKAASMISFSNDQKKEVHNIGAVYNEVVAKSGRYASHNKSPSYKLKLIKERQPISYRKPPKPQSYVKGIIQVNPKADLKQLFDKNDMPKWAVK